MTRTTQPRWPGDDFPSWLSPMVVKELRQGVQSGAFAWTFIALQAAMFLYLSYAVLIFEAGRGRGRTAFDFLFWPIVGTAVLFILPLRGLGAISGEKAGNNLDLVRLTQLSATKIVLGKWLAIVAQGALLVTAILPYVVLRYFFGDVNVIRDLATIGWLFVGSMLVAAAAIALSTKSPQVRLASVLLVLPSFVSIIELFDNPGGSGVFSGSTWLGTLAVIALYTAAMLEYSASTIAPIAENHALRKRSLALAIGVVWLLTASLAPSQTAIATSLITLPLLLAYAIEAVLERPVHLKSQAVAFARFGLPGRLAARVLTPGWPTGLVFVAVMAAMCLTAWWWWLTTTTSGMSQRDVVWSMAFGTLLVAAVVFPLPVFVWFPRLRYRFLLYLLIQLLSLLAFVYANVMKPMSRAWEGWPDGWMPLLPLPVASIGSLMSSNGSPVIAQSCLLAGGVVTVGVCLAVLRPWLREMRETGRLLADARATLNRRAAPSGGATA